MKAKFFVLLLIFSFSLLKAQSIYEPMDLSKVKYSLSDFGKMWTFDDVPVDKFEKQYGFKPSEEWLKEVQLSALQFGNGCSAAFVSQDGLIMTNHHCGRGDLPGLSPTGQDYLKDGYYAQTLSDELKVKDLFVDQLINIVDVTSEVIDALNSGKTDKEKVDKKNEKIKELENKYSAETGLVCKVVQLYNGGKYSLYQYKRYNDLRLVMAPDFQIASTGWDWDNFTYPRYELDFMFYRAYENEKPIKTENFFKWSKKGAERGEPIFVVGRPGRTQRLISVSQLEFLRDKQNKYTLLTYNELYKVYFELFKSHPERYTELLNRVMGVGNGRKSVAGGLVALNNNYIMAKKRDFEKSFIEKVNANPELKSKYGHIWGALKNNFEELNKYVDELFAFSLNPYNRAVYFNIAEKLIKYAEQVKLPEDKREPDYKAANIEKTLSSIYPDKIDTELQTKLIKAFVNVELGILGNNHPILSKIFINKSGDEAVDVMVKNSKLMSKDNFEALSKKAPDEILNSSDPFIYFLVNTQNKVKELRAKTTEINATVSVLNQLLGEVAFKVFGDEIPPDATATLRIADGSIEDYEYNGTIAPGKTTYYGLWDRWNSFGKKDYPWGLHPRWQNVPPGLDLATPIAFASTNDIVGGNSGSSAINKNKEVIGLIHDGNLESLAGDFIFLPENNRAVATDSWGLLEALRLVYKTDRIVKELENSKM